MCSHLFIFLIHAHKRLWSGFNLLPTSIRPANNSILLLHYHFEDQWQLYFNVVLLMGLSTVSLVLVLNGRRNLTTLALVPLICFAIAKIAQFELKKGTQCVQMSPKFFASWLDLIRVQESCTDCAGQNSQLNTEGRRLYSMKNSSKYEFYVSQRRIR